MSKEELENQLVEVQKELAETKKHNEKLKEMLCAATVNPDLKFIPPATPCIQIVPTVPPPTPFPPINPNTPLTPEFIAQLTEIIRQIRALIHNNTMLGGQITRADKRNSTIIINNMDIVHIAEEYILDHEDIKRCLVDVEVFVREIEFIDLLQPLVTELNRLGIAVETYNIGFGASLYRRFMAIYNYIKLLEVNGCPEAREIWQELKQMFIHLFGRRGPQCQVKELVHLLAKAEPIIKKNQGMIAKIINDEAKLAEYLTHEIHLDDDTADHCLKALHAIKEEKGWIKN